MATAAGKRHLIALGRCPTHPSRALAPNRRRCQECLDREAQRVRDNKASAVASALASTERALALGAEYVADKPARRPDWRLGVYYIFVGREVAYVGKHSAGHGLVARAFASLQERGLLLHATRIVLEHYATEADVLAAESAAMRPTKPPLNRRVEPDRGPAPLPLAIEEIEL